MRKRIFTIALTALIMCACTDNFEEVNTHPYQISHESLKQRYNHMGSFFPTMLYRIFAWQVSHNLINDTYARYMATPTPFVGGVNNTTYYITWNRYWDTLYRDIMPSAKRVIEVAEEDGYEVFSAWAKLIRILGMSRLTVYHGPLIYSNYGSEGQTIYYDSEEELYNIWFSELDEIVAVLNANTEYDGLKEFDDSFNGDISKWTKFANSLRLRLAIRISNVSPSVAKIQGEKALSAEGGLMLTNHDNFYISLYGETFKTAVVCFEWNDTRMSATMESILVGYKDNRIAKYFAPATDKTLFPDHPAWPYKGVRNGAKLVAKGFRTSFSTLNESFKTITERRLMTCCEVHFLMAEAALRGWQGGKSAQHHYERGIAMSFAEWGASGLSNYLKDDISLPIDYDDPKARGPVNDFKSRITTTIKWDEAADNEIKLEKIITQKWISGFTNSMEAWTDHRRTGYPKLPYNYQNDSSPDWGIIPNDDFLRRMPFVKSERDNNPEGIADATQKLGGPDEIGTRLWWDTGTPNF